MVKAEKRGKGADRQTIYATQQLEQQLLRVESEGLPLEKGTLFPEGKDTLESRVFFLNALSAANEILWTAPLYL